MGNKTSLRKKEINMILLGTGESGKTTFYLQTKERNKNSIFKDNDYVNKSSLRDEHLRHIYMCIFCNL
jgi:hypothetical protein